MDRAGERENNLPKYARVAASLRAQIADGVLAPGEPVPSAAALSRTTGYSTLTCRKALRLLIKDGALVSGASQNARPRVPVRALTAGARTVADTARDLSTALATLRRFAGLTQVQLAETLGVSVTTVGHAETGRAWQSRGFWERVDKELSAGGELLALHDAYRAAAVPADPGTTAEDTELDTAELDTADVETPDVETSANVPPTVMVAASGPVACVTITWANGAVTTVYPPETPAQLSSAILAS